MSFFVAAGPGANYVGFVGAAYSYAAALATLGWGRLVQRPGWGRRHAMAAAVVLQLSFYGMFVQQAFARPSEVLPDDATPAEAEAAAAEIAEAVRADPAAMAALFLGTFLASTVDPVWNSFLPATMQTIWSSGPQAPCAMASIRFYYSLAFAAQASISLALGAVVVPQMLGLSALVTVSAACLWHLHHHVTPIDAVAAHGSSEAGPGAIATAHGSSSSAAGGNA
jgi:hypothetical protein